MIAGRGPSRNTNVRATARASPCAVCSAGGSSGDAVRPTARAVSCSPRCRFPRHRFSASLTCCVPASVTPRRAPPGCAQGTGTRPAGTWPSRQFAFQHLPAGAFHRMNPRDEAHMPHFVAGAASSSATTPVLTGSAASKASAGPPSNTMFSFGRERNSKPCRCLHWCHHARSMPARYRTMSTFVPAGVPRRRVAGC